MRMLFAAGFGFLLAAYLLRRERQQLVRVQVAVLPKPITERLRALPN